MSNSSPISSRTCATSSFVMVQTPGLDPQISQIVIKSPFSKGGIVDHSPIHPSTDSPAIFFLAISRFLRSACGPPARATSRQTSSGTPLPTTLPRRPGEDWGPGPASGLNSGSSAIVPGALWGQTSWQTSHPNAQPPTDRARSGSISPLCSIVRYEIQRRASSTRGPMSAPVGQASIQRVQPPQGSQDLERGTHPHLDPPLKGEEGRGCEQPHISMSVRITARKRRNRHRER